MAIWRKNVPGVEKQFPNFDLLSGDLAYSTNDFKGAEAAWKEYVRLAPGKIAGWRRLAGVQERLGDLPRAIESVSEVIKLESEPAKKAGRFAWRARLKVASRDWDGAAADLSEGNKLDATNDDIQRLYPKFERSAEWLPNLKALDAAVRQSSDNSKRAVALLQRSEWLAYLEWNGLAFEDAALAFQADPNSLRAEVWKGILAWELGREDEAGQVAKTSLKFWVEAHLQWKGKDLTLLSLLKQLDQEFAPEVRAEALLNLHQPVLAWREVKEIDGARVKTNILLALQELPKAEAAARRAAEVHPSEPGVWIDMAQLEFRNGNVKEALDHLAHAKQVDPKVNVEELRQAILKTQLPN